MSAGARCPRWRSQSMLTQDLKAEVIDALNRLLLQSGIQGGEPGSYFSSFWPSLITLLVPVENALRQFETHTQAIFPNQAVAFTR